MGELHPDLLVNLTSDSWFGAKTEPWEHLALSVFAAVELRVGMVRAVNSGVSALIDPNGRLLRKTYADDPYREPRAADGMLVSAPRMAGGDTMYVRYGDWFVYLSIVLILVIGATVMRSPGRRRLTDAPLQARRRRTARYTPGAPSLCSTRSALICMAPAAVCTVNTTLPTNVRISSPSTMTSVDCSRCVGRRSSQSSFARAGDSSAVNSSTTSSALIWMGWLAPTTLMSTSPLKRIASTCGPE